MFARSLLLGFVALTPQFAFSGTDITLDSIRLSGSEHLMIHYLGRAGMPPAAKAARIQLLSRMALFGPRFSIGHENLKFSPLLTFDDNINGGFVNDSLVISGLPFRIDSEYKAVSGLLIGGGVTGLARMNLGDGLAASFRGGSSVGYAVASNLMKAGASGSACIEKMVDGSTFAHGCLDAAYQHVELGGTKQFSARVGIDKVVSSSFGVHELEADLQTARIDGATEYTQNSAAFSINSALAGQPMAIRTSLQLGEKVEGVLSMREKLSLGASLLVAERPTAVVLSVQNNRGGQFLGDKLSTRATSISINYQVNRQFTTGARITRTASSASFFKNTSLAMNAAWRF